MNDGSARSGRFETQTMVLMGGRVFAYGLTMTIPLVLVRALSPESFGTYKQVFLVFSTLWTVLQLGLAESLYYFFPEEPHARRAYVGHTLLVLGVAGGVACAALWAGRELLASALHNPNLASYTPLIGLYLWLMLPSCLLESVMIIERRAGLAALTTAALEAVKMAAVVGPALMGAGIMGILWGSIAHAALRLAVMGGYLSRTGWPACRLSWRAVGRHWAYAAPLGISAVVAIVQFSTDQYAVSAAYGAAVFAVYAVGLFQIPIVELVGTVTASTFMVELARLRGGERRAAVELWHRVTTQLAAVCFPVCAFAVVWAPELISVLFTDAYAASVPIFRVAACAALLAPLLTDAVLRVYGDTAWILRVNVIKLLLTVILVPAAVAWSSLAGVALAGVLLASIGKGLMLTRVAHRLSVDAARLLPWSALALVGVEAAVCLVPAAWASRLWATTPAESLGIGLIAYAALYAAVRATGIAARNEATPAVAPPRLPTEREAP